MTLLIGMTIMSFSVPVNLIRQWCYCPRVVYYLELTEFSVKHPAWVKQGMSYHNREELLWARRGLSRFGLTDGSKHHSVAMADENLGIHGIADMIIETADAIYPVEFKLSVGSKKRGDILQLVAYAMLAQTHFQKSCIMSFLVGKDGSLCNVKINESKIQQVSKAVTDIRTMLTRGYKPESSATTAQCGICEYINFCNDRF